MATTVAVTGAGGFIGAALCRRLADEGCRVLGLDLPGGAAPSQRPGQYAPPPIAERVAAAGAEFRPVDVTDAGAVHDALAGADEVVHTAAIVSDWGAMDAFVAVNTRGTAIVLEQAERVGVRRAAVLASVAVWGYGFTRPIADEGAPPRVCGAPYVDTKGWSELVALERGHTVVRPGDVYGPESIPWVVRPVQALQAGLFRLPGRGAGVMTPIHVDDLVDGTLRALRSPAAAGRAYTLHDGAPVPASAFFAHHASWLGRERVPTVPRALGVAGAWGVEAAARLRGTPPAISRQAITYVSRKAAYPNSRAREELGWAPAVGLAEGMAGAGRWCRDVGLLR